MGSAAGRPAGVGFSLPAPQLLRVRFTPSLLINQQYTLSGMTSAVAYELPKLLIAVCSELSVPSGAFRVLRLGPAFVLEKTIAA